MKKHIFRFFAAISLCAVASSCSQEELGKMPDGEYPLNLKASVEGMVSRTGDTDSWADGDTIRVRISNTDVSEYYPWVGKYVLNTDGTVKEAIDALAWPFLEGYVSAWYPFLKNDTEVSIHDQSKGYHAFNFMSARTERLMRYNEIVNLTFKHQMAKVRCKLIKGEGITDEDLETAKVSYYGFTKVVFRESGITGNVPGWITPTSDFEALLVPQDMLGQQFIKVNLTVTVNDVPIDKELIYTPEDGQANLKAGSAYTFKITVQKDRLVAQTVSGEWNDDKGSEDAGEVFHRVNFPQNHNQALSFSPNVTPVYGDTRAGEDITYLLVRGKEFTISYDVTDANYMKGFVPTVEDTGSLSMNCSQSGDGYTFQYTLKSQTVNLKYDDYAQVGDIYYSDGTWSRGRIEGKTPIGIVFRTDTLGTGDKPSNYDWADNRSIRGYVVALKDASTTAGKWQAGSSALLTDGNQNESDAKYSGYLNAVQIRESSLYPASTWACAVADNYKETAPVPEYNAEDSTNPYYSSGWYLPSIKQLWDIYNLYKLNLYLQMAGGTALLEGTNFDYWSSTEYRAGPKYTTSSIAFSINFYQAKSKTNTTKSLNKYVRSVLTF